MQEAVQRGSYPFFDNHQKELNKLTTITFDSKDSKTFFKKYQLFHGKKKLPVRIPQKFIFRQN